MWVRSAKANQNIAGDTKTSQHMFTILNVDITAVIGESGEQAAALDRL